MKRNWKWSTQAILLIISAAILLAADAPPDYVLGPGDEVSLWALGAEEISVRPIRLDPSGTMDIPLIGRVQASGLTVEQLRTDLSKKLETQVKRPQVTVTVTEFRSQPVSVLGAVNKPGAYQLQGSKTLLEILSLAEGARNDAGNTIRIMRRMDQGDLPLPGATPDPTGRFSTAEISLHDAIDAKITGGTLQMRPHDVVSVSRGQTVYVIGEVHKSGGFALGEHDRISVLRALSLAEGLGPLAAADGARILRETTPGSPRIEIPLNLKRVLEGKAEDLALKPDDILFVPNSRTKNVALRTLEAAINIGSGVAIFRTGYPRP